MGGNGGIDLSTIPLMTQAQEGALAELLPAVMGMMSGFPLGEAYQPGAYNVRTFPEFAGEHIVKKNGEEDGGGGGGDGRDGGDVIRKEQLSEKRPITKEQLTRPTGGTVVDGDGKREVIRDGTVAPKTALDEILDVEQKRQPLPRDWTLPTGGGEAIPPKFDPAFPSLPIGIEPYGQPTTSIPGMGGMAPMLSPVANPPSISGGKGGMPGTTPTTVPETQPISPTQQALTQPIVQPFREGMTGNYPRREVRR